MTSYVLNWAAKRRLHRANAVITICTMIYPIRCNVCALAYTRAVTCAHTAILKTINGK